jgi:hypothetical protein
MWRLFVFLGQFKGELIRGRNNAGKPGKIAGLSGQKGSGG